METQRIASIIGIASRRWVTLRAEWLSTHRELTAAERRFGVEWDGTVGEHRAAAPGKIVRASTGSWAREHGGQAMALTAAECAAAGLQPGPAND